MLFLFIYYTLIALLAPFYTIRNTKLNIKFYLIVFLVIFFPYFFINSGIRDIELLAAVGNYFLLRQDVYYFDANHQLYPYLPFLSPILGFTFYISKIFQFNFITLWRFWMIIILVALAYLIHKILIKSKRDNVNQRVILFLFSPISLFPVALHGHPDVLLLLFYVASIYLLFLKKEKIIAASIFFGLSILTKTWSVFFLIPMLITKIKIMDKFRLLMISGLTILLTVLFYVRFWHSSLFTIFDAVTHYGGSWVVLWGLQGLFTLIIGNTHFFPSSARSAWLICVLLPVYFAIYKKRIDIIKSSQLITLTIFVLTISWATQYIFWVWPFVVLNEKLTTIRNFSILSIPYVLISYTSFAYNLKIDHLIVFFSLPFWLYGAWLWYTSLRKIAK